MPLQLEDALVDACGLPGVSGRPPDTAGVLARRRAVFALPHDA